MAESAAEAPNMVIGTFMVNSHPDTVLFDTGTAPIAKRPYRMAPIEHEEVKKTIDELLTKGYILSTLSCLEFPRSCLLRRRIIRRGYNIQGIPGKDVTDEDVGSCKGVGVVTPRF